MFAEERKLKIIDLIKSRKKVTVPELCELFGVTNVTVRNDLRELQESGHIIRTHGGAILKTKTSYELDSRQKGVQNIQAKQKAASLAINLIEDGDTIILDTGTTTLELAKCLHQKRGLTVVTNDIEIAATLEQFEDINIVLIGGVLRKNFHCTIGQMGQSILKQLSVDKAFMACNSFSIHKGAMTPDISQAEMKQAMFSVANKMILLCDSEKFEKMSFAQFATLDQIDTIVTETCPDTIKKALDEHDIEVVTSSN